MIATSLIDIMMRVAPETRLFDKVLSHAHFLATHGRLASRRNSLNDAILALKISDEILSPLRVLTTDKDLAKIYLRDRVDPSHIVPTIAVLKTPAEIDAFDFPQRCVIKPTHACGKIIRRFNGEPLDRSQICKWLDLNYYRSWREANYRDLEPKIIVEPFVFDEDGPNDAQFICLNGKAKIIQWTRDRLRTPHRMLYDREWNALNASTTLKITNL